MRRLGLALLAVALLLPASGSPRAAAETGDPYGGELRVALQGPVDLNPLAFPENRLVQELVYESLTRLGTDQLPRPWLAASWTVDPGAATITMDLRPARWPGGSAITAQDVAWSFQAYLAAGVASGFSVAVVDADTVRFAFASGGGEFLGVTATLPIAWKSGSSAPTPNGPFLVAAETATSVDLVPNADHWNRRPYVDRLSFRFPYTLAKNPDGSTQGNDAACALIFRDVHLIGWPVSSLELNAERDCVATYGGFADGTNRSLSDIFRRVPHLGTADNPAFRFLAFGMNTQRAPLTDPRLRQAISRAIDRDLIAVNIEPGTNIADSPVSSANLAWFNPGVPRYRVDLVAQGASVLRSLERVNQYLDEIGYLDTDGDGFRQTPTGARFAFTLLMPNQASDPRIAKYLDTVAKLRAVGIDVSPEERPVADLRAAVRAGAFDLFADLVDTGGDPAFLFRLFHRDGVDNVVRVDDPTLNGLLETARDALDPNLRRQAVFDAQTWIATNAPVAPVIHMRALHSYDKLAWEGWVHGLGGIANFWSFTSVHAPLRGPLVVRVDAFEPTLRPGGQTDVLVRVRDARDDPVEGATLALAGQGLAATTGVTDGQGEFLVRFTAPDVTGPADFPISVSAAKPGYAAGTAEETITVHPAPRTFQVDLAKESPTMASGERRWVRVSVYDESAAAPAVGVTVTLTASPAELGGSFAQATGTTDASGLFETTFTADVTVGARFLIAATVTQAGYEPARVTTSIEVSGRSAPGSVPPTPALDTISMVAVVASLAALYGWRQRRKWTARKP